jgi:hypothetical protein
MAKLMLELLPATPTPSSPYETTYIIIPLSDIKEALVAER